MNGSSISLSTGPSPFSSPRAFALLSIEGEDDVDVDGGTSAEERASWIVIRECMFAVEICFLFASLISSLDIFFNQPQCYLLVKTR